MMYRLRMENFSSLIALWATAEELAADLDIGGGSPGGTVRAWKRRNSIPAEYWLPLVFAAQKRGIPGVSLEVLAQIASNNRPTDTEAA